MIGQHLASEIRKVITECGRAFELRRSCNEVFEGVLEILGIILEAFRPPCGNILHIHSRTRTEDGFECSFALDLEVSVDGTRQDMPGIEKVIIVLAVPVTDIVAGIVFY